MAKRQLGEVLLQAGVIGEKELQAALTEQKQWGGLLGEVLIGLGLLTEDTLVRALSAQLRVPSVDVTQLEIDKRILDMVPGEVAFEGRLLPFRLEGRFLDVAMADPMNDGVLAEIRIRTKCNIRPHIAGPKTLAKALEKYYGQSVTGIAMGYGLSAGASMLEPTMDGAGLKHPEPAAHAAPSRIPTANPVSLPAPSAVPMNGAGGTMEAHLLREVAQLQRLVSSLQSRVHHLEALSARDEDVLRKLLGLLVDKGVLPREEIIRQLS